MPIADETVAEVVGMTVSVTEVGTGTMVSFDVPSPIPAGMSITESAVRAFYQRMVNALESSPDFEQVRASLITKHHATITPDGT